MAEGEEKSRRVSSAELKAKEEHATKAEGGGEGPPRVC